MIVCQVCSRQGSIAALAMPGFAKTAEDFGSAKKEMEIGPALRSDPILTDGDDV